jgi:hypothetical protein
MLDIELRNFKEVNQMFNLTESFKVEYENYLKEQANAEFEKGFAALEEAQKQSDEAFRIIKEYFNLYAKSTNLNEVKGEPGGSTDERKPNSQDEKNKQRQESDTVKKFIDVMSTFASSSRTAEDPRTEISEYKPIIGHAVMQNITSMKFPENIIFFIDSLISWIVNLVKKFIGFFTNAIRRFFGMETTKESNKITSEDLKLSLQRAQKIEAVAMPVSFKGVKEPKAVSMVSIDGRNIEKIRDMFELGVNASVEFYDLTNILTEAENENMFGQRDPYGAKDFMPERKESRQVTGISVDIAKDMENLHQLMQHFFDIFDNAYGSNQEYLFGVDDLEILLNLFKSTIKDIAEGSISTTAISGRLTSLELLNADKLRDNLKRTQLNTDQLKKIYVEIERAIENSLTVITHKQLLAAEGMGVGFRFYSAATYIQMLKILKVLEPRIKETEKMEKEMQKMKAVFDKIVIQLSKQRQAIAGFGAVTYTSVYQRKVNDLFDGARYVSQTVSLRLATLGLYMKQIKDIREALANANAINSRNRNYLKDEIFK